MVLQPLANCTFLPKTSFRLAYSFAKTPLKAAHAPLAAASGIQGTLPIAVLWDGSGGAWGIASGIKGSASVSMAAGVLRVDEEGGRFLRRAMGGSEGVSAQGRVTGFGREVDGKV